MSEYTSKEEERAAWKAEYKQILQDSASMLYGGDPECEHDVVPGDFYSGIKCSKCPAWYCA